MCVKWKIYVQKGMSIEPCMFNYLTQLCQIAPAYPPLGIILEGPTISIPSREYAEPTPTKGRATALTCFPLSSATNYIKPCPHKLQGEGSIIRCTQQTLLLLHHGQIVYFRQCSKYNEEIVRKHKEKDGVEAYHQLLKDRDGDGVFTMSITQK